MKQFSYIPGFRQYLDKIKLTPPCYQCADRHARCHAECARYKSYLSEKDNAHNEYRSLTQADYIVKGYIRRANKRFRGGI